MLETPFTQDPVTLTELNPPGEGTSRSLDEPDSGSLPPRERLVASLRPQVSITDQGPDALVVSWGWGRLIMRSLPEGVHKALRGLERGMSRHEMATHALSVDSPSTLARLYYHLGELETRGLLEWSAQRGETRIAVLRPLGEMGFQRAAMTPEQLCRDQRYTLSSRALLRRGTWGVMVDSALGRATVSLEDRVALEVAVGLLRPATVEGLIEELKASLDDDDPDFHQAVEDVLQLLIDAGLARKVAPDGTTEEDRHAVLSLWAWHDLYFHQRSRFGRHVDPFGGTFPHIGRVPPPPALRPAWGTPRIELQVPDLVSLHGTEPSLGEVMERRTSLKHFSPRPVPLERLATFLYRVARVKDLRTFVVTSPDAHQRVDLEVTRRPYPGGGSAYELELYLAIARCEGVDSGLYHYDPLGHALEEVRAFDPSVQALLGYSCTAAQIAEPPPILVVVAARIARVAWKYGSIAYATVLKDLGVLYHSMYLVATAMQLAPCALGSGSPDMFAEATGLDPLCETSVGEFMLGLPDSDVTPPSER